jgi:hypothetical protein
VTELALIAPISFDKTQAHGPLPRLRNAWLAKWLDYQIGFLGRLIPSATANIRELPVDLRES